jgi:hypothetical protein
LCKYISFVVIGKDVALINKGMNTFKCLVENQQKEREVYIARSGKSIAMKRIFYKYIRIVSWTELANSFKDTAIHE